MTVFIICLSIYLTAIVTHALTRVYAPPVIVQHITHTRVEREVVYPKDAWDFQEEFLIEDELLRRYPEIRMQAERESMQKLMGKMVEHGFVLMREEPERRFPSQTRYIMRVSALPFNKYYGLSYTPYYPKW